MTRLIILLMLKHLPVDRFIMTVYASLMWKTMNLLKKVCRNNWLTSEAWLSHMNYVDMQACIFRRQVPIIAGNYTENSRLLTLKDTGNERLPFANTTNYIIVSLCFSKALSVSPELASI